MAMENDKEIIGDLKGLIDILNDSKEGYKFAGETTNSEELKGLFQTCEKERIMFAEDLKAHLILHNVISENNAGDVPGTLHRIWIDIKQAFSSHEDTAILAAIETGEKAALNKFDAVLDDPETHSDHLELLQKQRTGIRMALSEIETYRHRLDNMNE